MSTVFVIEVVVLSISVGMPSETTVKMGIYEILFLIISQFSQNWIKMFLPVSSVAELELDVVLDVDVVVEVGLPDLVADAVVMNAILVALLISVPTSAVKLETVFVFLDSVI